MGRAFEHYFGLRGGNLNVPILKSSNARDLPGGGGGEGMLKFRVCRRINLKRNDNVWSFLPNHFLVQQIGQLITVKGTI